MNDPKDLEALKREGLVGDGSPAHITAYQVQKCAAIIQAYRDGHDLWGPQVEIVVAFLQAAAVEGISSPGIIRPGTEELWNKIHALPWPPSGSPKLAH